MEEGLIKNEETGKKEIKTQENERRKRRKKKNEKEENEKRLMKSER